MNELRDVEAQFIPLDSLNAYDGNAKQHDSDNIDAIADSISEFGFRNPILAWHNEDGAPEIVAATVAQQPPRSSAWRRRRSSSWTI